MVVMTITRIINFKANLYKTLFFENIENIFNIVNINLNNLLILC